jgi:hypothetical protein
VDVLESGVYRVGLRYTSNRGGAVSLAVDGKTVAARIEVPSTFAGADTLGWRQWHHWNYLPDAAEVSLEKGRCVLRLTTVENGNMNYDCLDFERIR